MSLVSNAREAVLGAGTIGISLAEAALNEQAGRYVWLSVRDSGCGTGTGLGLSAVHGIVHQCGGFMRLESAPGRARPSTCFSPPWPGASSPVHTLPAVLRTPRGKLRRMGAKQSSITGAAWIHELIQLRGVREPLQFFTREKQWINEQHVELCRVPAPTFLEHERAQWMAAQLRGYGCRAEIDKAGNVLAQPWQPTGGPVVALTAHLDTVFAPKTREDIRVEAGGRLVGPGVSDNGAGLAALLGVARALSSSGELEGRQSDLLLVASVGEEGEGNLNGMRFLLSRQSPLASRIRAMLVLDGAGNDHITSQALGSRRFEITLQGPGGHSWSDFGTANPVHALARAIALFSDTPVEETPRASYNCGVIEGGASVNSIPQTARAKVDIRSESNDTIEELARALSAVVARAVDVENERALLGKLTSKIKEIGARPAGKLSEDASLLPYLRAVDAHLGIRSYLDCSSTDANIPLSMNIPAVSIGAGGQGGGAHTPQEWFQPEGRDLALRRILLTLCLLLREIPVTSGNGQVRG